MAVANNVSKRGKVVLGDTRTRVDISRYVGWDQTIGEGPMTICEASEAANSQLRRERESAYAVCVANVSDTTGASTPAHWR